MRELLIALTLLAVGVGSAWGDQLSGELTCSKGCPDEATATVEQVFKAEDEGFSVIAYQVTWRGHKVIVEDPVRWTNLSVGDKVRFLVLKHDMTSQANGKRLLSFTVTKP